MFSSVKTAAGLSSFLVVGIGAMASASIPAADGTFTGCYKRAGGALRLIDASATCTNKEVRVTWNEVGQQGPPGPAAPVPQLNYTIKPAPLTEVADGRLGSTTAECEDRQYAFHGQYDVTPSATRDFAALDLTVVNDGLYQSSGVLDTYALSIVNHSGQPVLLSATVFCADIPQ